MPLLTQIVNSASWTVFIITRYTHLCTYTRYTKTCWILITSVEKSSNNCAMSSLLATLHCAHMQLIVTLVESIFAWDIKSNHTKKRGLPSNQAVDVLLDGGSSKFIATIHMRYFFIFTLTIVSTSRACAASPSSSNLDDLVTGSEGPFFAANSESMWLSHLILHF